MDVLRSLLASAERNEGLEKIELEAEKKVLDEYLDSFPNDLKDENEEQRLQNEPSQSAMELNLDDASGQQNVDAVEEEEKPRQPFRETNSRRRKGPTPRGVPMLNRHSTVNQAPWEVSRDTPKPIPNHQVIVKIPTEQSNTEARVRSESLAPNASSQRLSLSPGPSSQHRSASRKRNRDQSGPAEARKRRKDESVVKVEDDGEAMPPTSIIKKEEEENTRNFFKEVQQVWGRRHPEEKLKEWTISFPNGVFEVQTDRGELFEPDVALQELWENKSEVITREAISALLGGNPQATMSEITKDNNFVLDGGKGSQYAAAKPEWNPRLPIKPACPGVSVGHAQEMLNSEMTLFSFLGPRRWIYCGRYRVAGCAKFSQTSLNELNDQTYKLWAEHLAKGEEITIEVKNKKGQIKQKKKRLPPTAIEIADTEKRLRIGELPLWMNLLQPLAYDPDLAKGLRVAQFTWLKERQGREWINKSKDKMKTDSGKSAARWLECDTGTAWLQTTEGKHWQNLSGPGQRKKWEKKDTSASSRVSEAKRFIGENPDELEEGMSGSELSDLSNDRLT